MWLANNQDSQQPSKADQQILFEPTQVVQYDNAKSADNTSSTSNTSLANNHQTDETHNFHIETFYKPTYCSRCGEFIFGLKDQGFKCNFCKRNFCPKCKLKAKHNGESCLALTTKSVSGTSSSTKSGHPKSSTQITDNKFRWLTEALDPLLHRLTKLGDLHYEHQPQRQYQQSAQISPDSNTSNKVSNLLDIRVPQWSSFRQEFCTTKDTSEPTTINHEDDKQVTSSNVDTTSSETTNKVQPLNSGLTTIGDLIDWNSPTERIDCNPVEECKAVKMTNSNLSGDRVRLHRLAGSVKQVKQPNSTKSIIEGWLNHNTSWDDRLRKHYWRLDETSITLYENDMSKRYFESIALNTISRVLSDHTLKDRVKEDILLRESANHTPTTSMHLADDTITKTNQVQSPVRKTFGFERTNGSIYLVRANDQIGASRWKRLLVEIIAKPTSFNQIANQKPSRLKNWRRKEICIDPMRVLEHVMERRYLIEHDPSERDGFKILGEGQFGKVYAAISDYHLVDPIKGIFSGVPVAIKKIRKDRYKGVHQDKLKNETDILSRLDHPGVIILEGVHDVQDKIYIVMEQLDEDMLEMILSTKENRLSEQVTKFLIYQILEALRYLHAQNIAHCDLKPENVLLVEKGAQFPQIKLCDFGYAKIIEENSFRKSMISSPQYQAPEVIEEKYNRSVDLWSVGVIVYVCLSGQFPFDEKLENIHDMMSSPNYMYPDQPWATISIEAKNFINSLLCVDSDQRPSAKWALKDDWMQDYQLWCDLFKLETATGIRWLTDDADLERWMKYAKEHQLPLPENESRMLYH